MKSCPSCQRTFDDTLTFCLIDGSVLSAPNDPNETPAVTTPHVTGPPPTAILNPTTNPGGPRPPQLSTIVSPQPLPLYSPPKPQSQLEEKQSGKPWVVIGIAISVVFILVVGTILSFIWLGRDDGANNKSDSKVANTNLRPGGATTATTSNGGWGATNERASLNGERLTYYPGTTAEQCQADCDQDSRCNGFTFIRAGAYNPNDSAMCYQLSVAKEMVSHPCCISAIKR
jgi:PAN domain-containing protein